MRALLLLLALPLPAAAEVGRVGGDRTGNDVGIAAVPSGEEVFRESRSIIFKSPPVRRSFDEANRTLIDLVHGRDLTDRTARMAISTVPLYGADR